MIPTGRPKSERLDKVLASAGIGSRREVRQWIREGRVTVDGNPARDPGLQVLPSHAVIEVDGQAVSVGSVTLMLNKPRGVITATADRNHATVADLLPPALARRLVPVGRLDKDTEGLLIMTDDGALCHRIISPRHGVEKEYLAVVDGPIPPHLAEAFARGVQLDDGYVTRPALLQVVEPGPPGVARVTVTEGKYHQVRRMFAAFGLTVTALRRLRIGSLVLDDALAPGEFRRLRPEELPLLLVNPGGEEASLSTP